MQARALLNRLPDSLPSLGADANFLSDFKYHCNLIPNPAWTELDRTLSRYLDAAEKVIDLDYGTTYRARNFQLRIQNPIAPGTWVNYAVDRLSARYYSLPASWCSAIRLPCRFLNATPVVAYTDQDGVTGTFVEGTDFVFVGGQSLTPEITWLPSSQQTFPNLGNVPWPLTVTFSTVANTQSAPNQALAILTLGAYFYRNPEGMGVGVEDLGSGFEALVGPLQGSFL